MASPGKPLPWNLKEAIRRLLTPGPCEYCDGGLVFVKRGQTMPCGVCDGSGERGAVTRRKIAAELGICKRTVDKIARLHSG